VDSSGFFIDEVNSFDCCIRKVDVGLDWVTFSRSFVLLLPVTRDRLEGSWSICFTRKKKNEILKKNKWENIPGDAANPIRLSWIKINQTISMLKIQIYLLRSLNESWRAAMAFFSMKAERAHKIW
jgi:hypothetical protein